jgi:hypothetical protein
LGSSTRSLDICKAKEWREWEKAQMMAHQKFVSAKFIYWKVGN